MIKDGGFTVKVLKDSAGPKGHRITTICARYPRFIHSEIMTHRELSRNAASSRAIPVEKLIQMVETEPVVPIWWGKNEPGMVARAELDGWRRSYSEERWLKARDNAVLTARQMVALGLHKQIVNRIIEPWMWITVIITSTQWNNVWGLRCHPDAEPHFQKAAGMWRQAIDESVPERLEYGEWHLPYVQFDDLVSHSSLSDQIKLSVGRCARVSYLTHDGKRDPQKDIELHDRMMVQVPLHASPAEHQAQAVEGMESSGNLRGEWLQYRKTFANEYIR